jgi:POT family proton-dependent oligopeptide transporter
MSGLAKTRPAGDFLGHPAGLSILFGTEMWERFCYYGMRALLTFYMVDFLFLGSKPDSVFGYGAMKNAFEWFEGPLRPQPLAALVYGTYTSLTYLTGVVGGAVADRFLGQRKSVVVGAITMATGEFLLMDPRLFFAGLAVLVIGNGFFKPNISTQVGGLYAPGDRRIDRAYSIFYVGINLGALIAPPICGRLGHSSPGQPPHWQYGFAASGVGMLIGLAIYLAGQRKLPPDVRSRRLSAEAVHGVKTSLSRSDWVAIVSLILVAFCNLFFWACYEQQGITIALMAQNNTNLHTWFGTLAPEDIQSFNPFFIFTLTPAIIAFWAWQGRRGIEPSPVTKMAIGCAGISLCYLMLILPAQSVDAGAKVSVLWLVGAMALLTIGELYLSPVSLSLFSKAAPARVASLMMGVNFLSNCAGNFLAGYLGQFWEGMHKTAFFGMIAVVSLATSVAIFVLSRVLNPVLRAREQT